MTLIDFEQEDETRQTVITKAGIEFICKSVPNGYGFWTIHVKGKTPEPLSGHFTGQSECESAINAYVRTLEFNKKTKE